MTPYVTGQSEMLDLICHRFYGRSAGTTEAVLAANPGLAALGPVLPFGTRILLPDLPTGQRKTRPLTSLWD